MKLLRQVPRRCLYLGDDTLITEVSFGSDVQLSHDAPRGGDDTEGNENVPPHYTDDGLYLDLQNTSGLDSSPEKYWTRHLGPHR